MKNELELLKVLRVASECNTFREAAIKLGASPQAGQDHEHKSFN